MAAPPQVDSMLDDGDGLGHLFRRPDIVHIIVIGQHLYGGVQLGKIPDGHAEGIGHDIVLIEGGKQLLAVFSHTAHGLYPAVQTLFLADEPDCRYILGIFQLLFHFGNAVVTQVILEEHHYFILCFHIAYKAVGIEAEHNGSTDQQHTGHQYTDGCHRHLFVCIDIPGAFPQKVPDTTSSHCDLLFCRYPPPGGPFRSE